MNTGKYYETGSQDLVAIDNQESGFDGKNHQSIPAASSTAGSMTSIQA